MSDRRDETDPPQPPAISRVRYDGALLTVFWTAPDGGRLNPASSYEVDVGNGKSTVTMAEAGQETSASLPLEVADGQEYDVKVGQYTGNAHKGDSAPVAIVTGTVAIDRAETDPVTGALTLAWTAARSDEFLLRLVVNGGSPDPEPTVTGQSFVLTQPPPPGASVSAVLARVQHDQGALTIGPDGPAFAVPTERPELLAAGFEADTLQVAWTGVPSADGYRVSVLQDGAVLSSATVPAPATTLDLVPGITDRLPCTVVVQALDDARSGPPSAPLPVLLTAPEVTAVDSDGVSVSITVAPPHNLTPTGYDVVLLRDGVPVHRASPGATTPLSLPVSRPLPRGAAYAVSVRARSGRSVGPAGTAPAVLATPAVASVVCDAELTVTAAAGALPADLPIDAVLSVDGVPGRPERVGAGGIARFPVPSGGVGVAVRGVADAATGPWSVPVPAPTTPVAFTLARVDDGRVVLAWKGPPDGTFRAAVGPTGVVTRGNTAVLPRTTGPATVAQLAGVATGPVTSIDLVTAGPRLTAVAVGTDRGVTLWWTAPQSPPLTGLQPVIRWDGAELALDVQPPTANPLVLTLPEDVPNTAMVALRAVAGVAVGPPGNAAALLTTAPTGLTVTYDGADLCVSWDALSSPLVSGYRVSTVIGATTTVLGDTPTTAGTWRVELTDTSAAVVVQALTGSASGAPSAPVPVFTEALYLGRSYLAPQRGPVLTATDLDLRLPELFASPLSGAIDLPLAFTLTPGRSGPYAYTLRIPAASPVWDFTDRPNVIASWGELLGQLQPLGLTPYGAAVLTEAVSRAMPQTFAETLYFTYGLQFDRGCFDLRPGLVVRVEYESYQTAGGAQGKDLSGFVTGGSADYEVASYDRSGTWLSGLDAFLAALSQKGVVVPNPSGPDGDQLYGSGGVFDLFASALQLPYARLVYPPQLLRTTSPGSTKPQDNAVLLAGPTPASLDAATDNVRRGSAPGPGVAKAYLRGRAIVRALVRITVNGAPRLVPLGTTLGNVLASEGRRPPALPVPLPGVTLHRARAAAALLDGPAGDWRVVPGWEPREAGALDLPLLHGDRLDLVPGAG
ncbi:hypothetical protein ACWGE1_22605 [Streptomyces sp. NPDC054932]